VWRERFLEHLFLSIVRAAASILLILIKTEFNDIDNLITYINKTITCVNYLRKFICGNFHLSRLIV